VVKVPVMACRASVPVIGSQLYTDPGTMPMCG
jgi:hypothetical protein